MSSLGYSDFYPSYTIYTPTYYQSYGNSNSITKLGYNQKNVALLKDHGLAIQTVSWEDTARTKGSVWGPNISDMTLKVGNISYPMIRKPNMSDRTMDIPIEKFKVPVGNEKGEPIRMISLKEYLENISSYVSHDADKIESMYLDRDTSILTQTQCCVLECKDKETIEFSPAIYNYQSSRTNPRVLTIMISANGTSTTLLGHQDNHKLYYNDNGVARNFSGSRVANEREKKTGKPQKAVQSFNELDKEEKLENCLMIIQVPLKEQQGYKPMLRGSLGAVGAMGYESDVEFINEYKTIGRERRRLYQEGDGIQARSVGFDMAKVGNGSEQGEFKFSVNRSMKLERDDRYPIRCTYQYYRLTDKVEMSQELVDNIAEELKSIEQFAIGKGSLVYSTDKTRATEPDLTKKQNTVESKPSNMTNVWNTDNGML